MFSEFHTLKIAHVVHISDPNGDGYLEESDMLALADRLSEARGYTPGSAGYKALHDAYQGLWQGMQALDTDGDGRVSVQETVDMWGQLAHAFNAGGETANQVLQHVYGMLDMYAGLMDTNGDGRIDVDEMMTNLNGYFHIQGANETFAHLDIDGNGYIDKQELVQLFEQYYLMDDPDAPGNWLFGRLPEKNPYA